MKHWSKFCVTAIAVALFKHHDCDFDLACVVAYWFKSGKPITDKYQRYAALAERIKVIPAIPADDADGLIKQYRERKC
jgi:hypothetical protein